MSGIGGCVLGVIFLGLGLFIRHRSQKGEELWRTGWWAVPQEGAGLGVVGCAAGRSLAAGGRK